MNKLPALLVPEKVGSPRWRTLLLQSSDLARERIPYELAKKLAVLPLVIFQRNEREILSVALTAPLDPQKIKEICFLTGLEIEAQEEEEEQILKALDAAYGGNERALVLATEKVNQEKEKGLGSEESTLVSDKPTPQLLERLLERAISLAASDIHLEPQKKHYQIRFRVHGLLQKEQALVTHHAAADLIRRIKVLAKLDTTCTKKPQEGVFHKLLGKEDYTLRLSLVPQYFGEKAVIRLFEHFEKKGQQKKTSFLELGLSQEEEFLLKRYLALESGAVILSGPTGSGKTTLLYGALSYLEREWRNIVSLEDPVEQVLANINQIDCKRGVSQEELLIALLRQDPDVMMVGEIRDKKTAEIALSASLTGHLVLSTVHARNCLEVFSRFFQFGISKDLLAVSLKLIISQRLVQLNCKECLREELAKPELQKFFSLDFDTLVKSSSGCKLCSERGVSGRKGVYEFLPVNEEISDLLLSPSGLKKESYLKRLKRVALNSGYRPYAFSVREALINGEISPKTALRVLGMAPELMGY